jgi:hypothetical protein
MAKIKGGQFHEYVTSYKIPACQPSHCFSLVDFEDPSSYVLRRYMEKTIGQRTGDDS